MPKLAEAWVDITTKDAQFYKGMGNARKEVEATGKSFSRAGKDISKVAIVGERTWHRVGSEVRRTINDLKHLASTTEGGRSAVEGFERAEAKLVDTLLHMSTGLDLDQFFDVMAAGFRSLNVNELESKLALVAEKRHNLRSETWLRNVLGIPDTPEMVKKDQELTKEYDRLQNELTQSDLKESERRIKQAAKEKEAKQITFMGMEEVWKDAQRRMSEKEAGIRNKEKSDDSVPAAGGAGLALPAAGGAGLALPAAGGAGLALPAGMPFGMPNKNRGFQDFTGISPDGFPAGGLTHDAMQGALHEFIDHLEQSGNPADRAEALRLQQMQKLNSDEQLRVLRNILDEIKNNNGGLGP